MSSAAGAELRSITLEEAMSSTRTAIELGMNFIDTSPFYGRGMSEILLGLKGIPQQNRADGIFFQNAHFFIKLWPLP